MENSIVMNEDIGMITAEIKQLANNARGIALAYATQIGKRLVKAKELVPHGGWGMWLKTEFEFSVRSAQNFIKLYEEYGDIQINLLDMVSNTQPVAHLSYSKALALLSVPEEEREEFAEKVEADKISRKELQDAIKARDKAIKDAEKASKDAEEARQRAAEATKAAEANIKAAESAEKLSGEVLGLQGKVKELEDKLKSKPKLSKKEEEKIRAEITEELNVEKDKLIENIRSEANSKVQEAEEARKEANFSLENIKVVLADAEKRLKMFNPKVTEYKVLFDTIQETYKRLIEVWESIKSENPDVAASLNKAFQSFVDFIMKGKN